MTRDRRRYERQRVIQRRLNIIRFVWGYNTPEKEEGYTWGFRHPGRFAKYNLKCTCSLCKLPRYKRTRYVPDSEVFGVPDDDACGQE